MPTKDRPDPAIALLWAVNSSVMASAAASLTSALTLFAAVVACGLIVLRASPRGVLRYWRVLLFVPSLLFIFHAAFTPGDRLLGFGPVSISREGLLAGSSYMIRLATSVAAALFVITTIDLSSVAPSLMRVGVPKSGAFAIYLMLRFVPLMTSEADTVRLALLTRMPVPSLRNRVLRFRRYLLNLVVVSLRRAEQTALAMDARGFASTVPRTTIHDTSVVTLTSALLMIAALMSWAIIGLVR